MILVIGGAYQGKENFVKEEFSLENKDIFHCSEDISCISKEKLKSYRVISGIEKIALSCYKNGNVEAMEVLEKLGNDKIFIGLDISQGVVPIDKEERGHREANGRMLINLAQKSERVIRVFCGIGKDIK